MFTQRNLTLLLLLGLSVNLTLPMESEGFPTLPPPNFINGNDNNTKNVENNTNNSIPSPEEITLKQLNFKAGRKLLETTTAKIKASKIGSKKEIIKPKEFEKNPYKEILKHYSVYLSNIASKELDKLIKENLEFYAIYKANFYNIGVLTYETTKDLPELINNVDYYKMSNKPFEATSFKVVWSQLESKMQENLTNTNIVKTKPKESKKDKRTPKKLILDGYCIFPRTIKIISPKPFYTKVLCNFRDIRGVMWGAIIPDFKNKMVLYKPIKFESEDGKKYVIKEAVVLNAKQTSPNIATKINTRMLEKMLAKAGMNTAKDIKEAVEKKYLGNQGKEIYVGGDIVVKEQKYEINIGDLAIKSFLANLFEGVMDLVQKNTNNIPAIFIIEKGTAIYVNGIAILK